MGGRLSRRSVKLLKPILPPTKINSRMMSFLIGHPSFSSILSIANGSSFVLGLLHARVKTKVSPQVTWTSRFNSAQANLILYIIINLTGPLNHFERLLVLKSRLRTKLKENWLVKRNSVGWTTYAILSHYLSYFTWIYWSSDCSWASCLASSSHSSIRSWFASIQLSAAPSGSSVSAISWTTLSMSSISHSKLSKTE